MLRRGIPLALRAARRSRPFIACRGLVRIRVARFVVARIEARRRSERPLAVQSTSEFKIKLPGYRLNGEVVPLGVARLTLRVRGEASPGREVQIEWRMGADSSASVDRAWSALEYGLPTTLVTRLGPLDDGSIGVVVDSWQPGHWSGDPIPEDPPPARFRWWASVEFRIRALSELDTISSDRHPRAGIRAASSGPLLSTARRGPNGYLLASHRRPGMKWRSRRVTEEPKRSSRNSSQS